MNKVKYIIFTLAVMVLQLNIYSQSATGEWVSYLSYNNSTIVESYGDLTYIVDNGNLYSFNSDDNSIETYTKINILNDTKIEQIKYSPELQTLVIAYQNGNIDLLIQDEETCNIPYLMESTKITVKTTKDIYINGDYAYMSGDYGICVLNIKKKEIANYYSFTNNVNSCIVKDNTIYATAEEGVYKGDMSKNLLDKSNWEKTSDNAYFKIMLLDGNIYYANKDGLYKHEDNTNHKKVLSENIEFAEVSDNKIIYGRGDLMGFFTSDGKTTNIKENNSYKNIKYNSQKNIYWCACSTNGTKAFDIKDNTLLPVYTNVTPNSPARELYYFMKFYGEDLYIGGGKLNVPVVYNPGTVMVYRDGKWESMQEGFAQQHTGIAYFNITSVAPDPRNNSRVFAASAFGGLYEFENGEFKTLYTYYADPQKANSSLKSVVPKDADPRLYVRVDGLNFDKDNNLWMVNSGVSTIINVMKNNGEWVAFDHEEIAKTAIVDKLIFDNNGYIWITLRRKGTGLFCFDYNNTIDDTSDDRTKLISNYINQDGTVYGELATYDIVLDKKGSLWIGTEKGPFVINNPSKIFNSSGNFQVTQIKVPRNDGTNLADYLLKDEIITSIAVDGGNRKWLGTQNTGIYLVSEDGLELIQHFDTSNSPLFSNSIESLAINPTTGELFIGTDKGLMSYRTDSSEPEETFNDEAIYAFPNPVEPDYDGVITVTGLVYDTDVKITNTAGRIVASGKSNGGTFTWDGRNSYGAKVPSGIYFVLAADSEGKNGIVTKITIIR